MPYIMSSDTNENLLFLIVLGFIQKLRSFELTSLTAKLEDCIFVDPPLVRTSERTPDLINEVRSEALLGRRMTNGEIGCAKGHKQVIVAAHNGFMTRPKACWVLVAEDDAGLTYELYQKVGTDLASLDIRVPTFVNFYFDSLPAGRVPKLGTTVNSKFQARRKWQNRTVCYALNRAAVEKLLPFVELPIDYIADWPLYFVHLKHFVTRQFSVNETGRSSMIWDESNSNQSELEYVRNFSSTFSQNVSRYFREREHLVQVSKLYEVPMRKILAQLITYPLIENAQVRLRKFFSFER